MASPTDREPHLRAPNARADDGRKGRPEKYDRILEAALHVFANHGFHESRISDVARAAGVADGTIYLYFKNKDDLLISLFETQLDAIIAGLREEIGRTEEPQQRLERAIRYHLALARDNPPLTQLITVELRRSSRFMKDYAKPKLREYLDLFEAILKDARKLYRSEVSTGMLTQVLFGALDWACVTWVNNPNRDPEQLAAVGDFLIELVDRALVDRPTPARGG